MLVTLSTVHTGWARTTHNSFAAGASVATLINAAKGFAVMLGILLVVTQVSPSPNIVFAPLFIALAILTALSVGVWLSALDVRYRDVRYAIPFMIQLWLFATPVVYPAALLSERVRPSSRRRARAAERSAQRSFSWRTPCL